ncbi:NAD(P)H-binding protein [Streptomyces sp. ST2-7A]|uniref:NAD(P)H-binding protein n=1 Tax=Streptomyces sp. ST2-7A TaxID=2907214 RepID=UPI001F37CF0F|nr:NAD(P)H-binding protein [Streptomyces sp. ST2-7A]MCE7081086.1 NAD(P)H-binding protein [Streptomyces sp. ST2-7A]
MTILVTGARGNVGRHVVEGLVRKGARVRALTRDPARAGFSDGVEVVRGDLSRLDSCRTALEGVTAMYLFPLAYRTSDVQSFADVAVNTEVPGLAAEAGVRRIVLLSSNAVLYGADEHHQQAEAAVEASGLEYTHLRSGEFAMNKLFGWGESIRKEGVVRSGFPEVVGVPIHQADVAAVAVVALLEDGHQGRGYELTGPQALTEREQVGEIAAGCGRGIRFEELTPEQARENWLAQGMPAEVVDEMMAHSAHFAEKAPVVRNTVQEVTGRPARTLRQWAADHAKLFR